MNKLALLLLAFALTPAKAQVERVVAITDGNVAAVSALLDRGWTVKHVAISGEGNPKNAFSRDGTDRHPVYVFVLSAPPPEVLAAQEAKRASEAKAAYDKKRADFLAKQPQVEKQ